METFRAARCCARRSVMPHDIQPQARSFSSSTLRHPHGRRKELGPPRSVRPLSTTATYLQEEATSPPVPQPQPQSNKTSTAPRPSPWASIFEGQRPHGTTPPPSTRMQTTLQRKLNEKVNVLDFVSSSKPSNLMARVEGEIRSADAKATHDSLAAVHLRLTPMLGRTLAVEPGIGLDLQSAFRVLEIRCSQNSVKNDSIKQRTHVRRGQAKKQLRSKRWRAMFKEGFLREVARVRRMKGQGW